MRTRMNPTILDAGRWAPPSRVIPGEDGEAVVEKYTSLPFDLYLNSGGHVVRVPLSTAASIRNPNNEYGLHMRTKMEAKGGLRYGLCPPAAVAAGMINPDWLTKKVREGKPCQVGTYNSSKPCPHMIEEREARIKRRAQSSQAREERQKGVDQKQLELQERHVKTLEKAILDGQGNDQPKSK